MRYDYRVLKTPSGPLLPPDWYLDNYIARGDDPYSELRKGGIYTREIKADVDGDDVLDTLGTTHAFDLRYRHHQHSGSIWVSTFPTPAALARQGVAGLMADYVASAAGSKRPYAGFFTDKYEGFTARVIDSRPAVIRGQEAYVATFDIANIDHLRLNPQHRDERIRAVLIRTPFAEPSFNAKYVSGTAPKIVRNAHQVFMLVAYANKPEVFDEGLRDFSDFVSRVRFDDSMGLQAYAGMVQSCPGYKAPFSLSAHLFARKIGAKKVYAEDVITVLPASDQPEPTTRCAMSKIASAVDAPKRPKLFGYVYGARKDTPMDIARPSAPPQSDASLAEQGSNPGAPLTASSNRPKASSAPSIIAVFDIDFRGVSLAQDIARRLSDYLALRLTGLSNFRVVPRSTVLEALLDEEKERSYKDCFDTSCQIELGKQLAAEKSLSTTVVQLNNECKITSVIYDLRTSVSDLGVTRSGQCTESGLVQTLERVVDALGPKRRELGVN